MKARTSIQEHIVQVLGDDSLTVVEIAHRARMGEMGAQSAVRALQGRGDLIRIDQGKGVPCKFRVAPRAPA